MAKSQPQFWKEIRAQGFVVYDDSGKPKISLDGKYGLRFFGEDGRPKASLGFLNTGQPALMFFHGPMPRVDLRLDEQGNPDLTLVGNRQLEAAEVLIRPWDKQDAEKERALRSARKPKPARRTAKRSRSKA